MDPPPKKKVQFCTVQDSHDSQIHCHLTTLISQPNQQRVNQVSARRLWPNARLFSSPPYLNLNLANPPPTGKAKTLQRVRMVKIRHSPATFMLPEVTETPSSSFSPEGIGLYKDKPLYILNYPYDRPVQSPKQFNPLLKYNTETNEGDPEKYWGDASLLHDLSLSSSAKSRAVRTCSCCNLLRKSVPFMACHDFKVLPMSKCRSWINSVVTTIKYLSNAIKSSVAVVSLPAAPKDLAHLLLSSLWLFFHDHVKRPWRSVPSSVAPCQRRQLSAVH